MDSQERTARALPFESLGPYRFLERLGDGGAGEVFRAEDSRDGSIVAVKLLRAEFVESPTERERFKREAEVARRVTHENCARVLDAGELEARPFVVYEFVPGAGLDQQVKDARARGRGIEFATVLRLGSELAAALSALHAAGHVHRDVKPANVRIARDGRAILLDFGLATGAGVDAVTRTGDFAGSLPYAPPEQIRLGVRAVDARADVYALAATLYECATGLPIHSGASLEQLILAIVRDDPLPPSRLDGSLPRAFDLVIGRALEKDPAARYPTMREFRDDLVALAEGRRVAARPRGIVRTIAAALRRSPRKSATAATAALLLIVAPSALYLHESAARRRLELEEANTKAAIDRAEQNLARALEAVESMLGGAAAASFRSVSGSLPTQLALLDDACRNYEDLLRANPDDPGIVFGHAHALRRRAVIAIRMGDVGLAGEILDRIVPMGRGLLTVDPGSADYHVDFADSLQARADWCALRGDREGFQRDVEEGIAVFERAAALAPDRTEPPRGIASFRNSLGLEFGRRGEFERAEAEYRASIAGMESVVARTNAIEDHRALAQAKNNLAALHAGLGRQDEAIAGYLEVLEIHDRLVELRKGDRQVRLDRASGLQNLSVAYQNLGRFAEAAEIGERIVAECEQLLGEETGSASVEYVLGLALTQLAGSYMRLSRHDESDAAHDRAVSTFARLVESSPDVPRYLANHGLALANRAIHHGQRKRIEAARDDYRRSLEQFDRALAIVPDDVSWSGLRKQIQGLAAKLPPEPTGDSP